MLPEHLSQDPGRKARFEREAKTISQLNHPHICTLYDVGEQDGLDYLVMEYIEGETLAETLNRGPLPVEKALEYGIQIADGLDRAHRAGIVHRDLKPLNVMLTTSGVKLLDFGLAKLVHGELDSDSDAPTKHRDLTDEQSIVGTLQYMAPEQLEGQAADARTDTFAFGAVLYEMLTGRKAFEGKSQASLISAIMKDDPPAISTQPVTPPALNHVVERCLAKEADERWQSASDVKHELSWIAESATVEATPHGVRSRRALPFVLAGVLASSLITGIAVWSLTRPVPSERSLRRFVVTAPSTHRLRHNVRLSHDGRTLFYTGITDDGTQIFRRSMDQLDSFPISGTEGAGTFSISPDGQWIAFYAGGRLERVSADGGPARSLCEGGNWGVSWAAEDRIVFSDAGSLMSVSALGGSPTPVTTVDSTGGEAGHVRPSVLPDGKSVLFRVMMAEGAPRIAVASLSTGDHQLLFPGTSPQFSATGHIVYQENGTLWAAPFDPDRLEVSGERAPIVDNVMVNPPGGGIARYTLSKDRSLAYFPASEVGRHLVWVDREGREERVGLEPRLFDIPRVSPDGTRVAVELQDPGNPDVHVYDLQRDLLMRLTFDPAADGKPLWTRDGQRVVFWSTRDGGGLFRKAADGTGEAERLTTNLTGSAQTGAVPHAWSRDGKTLVFYAPTQNGNDILTLSMEGGQSPEPLIQQSFVEEHPEVSPDGRWIAYSSNESDRPEIYVRPFPNVEAGRWQVSTDGGAEPVWGPDGRELFYTTELAIIVVRVETDPSFRPGSAEVLFAGDYLFAGRGRHYDISPDGKRFLMLKSASVAEPHIVVVLNWTEELKRRGPTDN